MLDPIEVVNPISKAIFDYITDKSHDIIITL